MDIILKYAVTYTSILPTRELVYIIIYLVPIPLKDVAPRT
jgi:hypothetical protein